MDDSKLQELADRISRIEARFAEVQSTATNAHLTAICELEKLNLRLSYLEERANVRPDDQRSG